MTGVNVPTPVTLSSGFVMQMLNKEDFKDFKAMTEKKTFPQ